MPQTSSANQDSVPSTDEDPYADLFGDARGDTPAQGSVHGAGVGDLGGFTSDNRATPARAETQAESEVSTRLAQYPPGVRAPSPGWFNPHPLRARGETGPFPGAPRPDLEGSMAPAARITDSMDSYAMVDPASSISLSAAGTVDSYMVTSQQSMIESQSQPGSSSTPGEVVSEGHLDPYAEATRRSVETPASGALPP